MNNPQNINIFAKLPPKDLYGILSKGYDGPMDVQSPVDESSQNLLPLLFLLASWHLLQCIVVHHRHAVKVKLIHLNGHPGNAHI